MADIVRELHDDLLILRVTGELSFDELLVAIKDHFPSITRDLVWDFREGTFRSVSSAQLERIPAIVRQHMPNRAGGKTAYVASADVDFGLWRMYTAIASYNKMPYDYSVFRDYAEALHWIGRPDLAAE